MEVLMEKFVEQQNIARFTTLLMIETDTAKRELLQKLLTDEMVRRASHSDAENRSQSTKVASVGALFRRETLFFAVGAVSDSLPKPQWILAGESANLNSIERAIASATSTTN